MIVTFTPFQASGSILLPPNQTMSPGQYLVSENGQFRLLLQADGHLVIKDGEVVVWVADGSQIYSRTVYRKKFASLFTLWWVITVFFMTHPEGVYGLLKVLIQGINHFGITPVWLFKMMGIWSFMISAQAIRAGPVSGSFLVEFQSQRTGWWRSCLMVCNFLNGGFNCHFLPSLANGLSIHGLLRTGGGCKQSGLYGSVWHL